MMLLCSQSFARYNADCHWLISGHVVSAKFRWISRGPKVFHAREKSLPRVGYNSMSRKKIVSMDFFFFSSSPSLNNKTLYVFSRVPMFPSSPDVPLQAAPFIVLEHCSGTVLNGVNRIIYLRVTQTRIFLLFGIFTFYILNFMSRNYLISCAS